MLALSEQFLIGTRGSMLAVAQCELIQQELIEKSGHDFQLKTIKTEGDLKTDKPLWQMDGKDFFTKELDQALNLNEVDLVVHSYKDLGSDRPENFELAAITERKYGEDILLIPNKNKSLLSDLKEFIVGTSSPRRIVNIEGQLQDFLPSFNGKISTKMLRGNVNTRIEKLKNGDYHAIVLAFAGLERLATNPNTFTDIKRLTKDLDYMILPHSTFASAASQGALGIEINKNSPRYHILKKAITLVDHDLTRDEMRIERSLFQKYGGGCHLAVGIQVDKFHDNYIIHERGKVDDQTIESSRTELAQVPNLKGPYFVGSPTPCQNHLHDELISKNPIETNIELKDNVFITSSHVDHALEGSNLTEKQLWASGEKSWKRLARKGLWIHGSSDLLGHGKIKSYLNSNLLKFFGRSNQTTVLTGKNSKSELGQCVECYSRDTGQVSDDYKTSLISTQTFYWTSYPQFEIYQTAFPEIDWKQKTHCCGMGKTYTEFQNSSFDAIPFYSKEEFLELAKNN